MREAAYVEHVADIAPGGTFLVRTWFGSDEAWRLLVDDVLAETDEGLRAHLVPVDDPALAGAGPEAVVAALPVGEQPYVIAIADDATFTTAGAPVLVVELHPGPQLGGSLRALPSALQSIENNLSIANMDFDEFVAAAGADGVFRGFGGSPQPPQQLPPPVYDVDPHADPDADAEMTITCDSMRALRLLWDHVDGGIRLRVQSVVPDTPYPGYGPQQDVGPYDDVDLVCPRCGRRVAVNVPELLPHLRRFEDVARRMDRHTSLVHIDLGMLSTWLHGPPPR